MWGQNTSRNNADSDQSISDEEDVEPFDDVVSLNNPATAFNKVHNSSTRKEELPLLVRLDILKGTCDQDLAGKSSNSLFEKPTGTPLEDEVEMPDFKDGDYSNILGEVVANSTDEEAISEDEGITVLSTREPHKYGPRVIRNEQARDMNEKSEASLRFKESTSFSTSHATCSDANRSGICSKTKPRFSLPSLSHGCFGPSVSNFDRLPEIVKTVDPEPAATLDGNHQENDGKMELNSDIEPAEMEADPRPAHGFNLSSMADLFDNLQDKTSLCFPHVGQRRGKTIRPFQKRSRSHLQDTIVDSEDSPEPVGSESSSDSEVSNQKVNITLPGKKMPTMADRFQEALGTSSVIDGGTHVAALSVRARIFGKLQQVMQKEKERDMDFWKKLQTGARPDSELGCVDVKIISRCLDGKLIVCRCSFSNYTENFLLRDNSKGIGFGGSKSSERTIIFNLRVCNNVDLEVGNLIRIHPPWKEVQVGNDDIILCTYFSEISSRF